MRLHRFYVSHNFNLNEATTIDSPDLVHQLRRVFRLGVGDRVIFFTGTGIDFECKIYGFGEENKIGGARRDASVHVTPVSQNASAFFPAREIILYASLVKKDTFEWIVQKATELGVTKIVPILAERSEKKDINVDRLQKIVVEASEQCGRGDVPRVHIVHTMYDIFSSVEISFAENLVFHTSAAQIDRANLSKKNKPVNVFIGPEGGWSEKEIEMFHKAGATVVSLGPQILRAETAAVAALSLVIFG